MSQVSFLQTIEFEMSLVGDKIRENLSSRVALIQQIGDYISRSGGKRLRPALLILFAKATGYQGELIGVLGAVVEFIHTATLLHDDIVDESELRRGNKTANVVFGNAASVLVGDFLYSRAFQMMTSTQSLPVMEVLADATNVIAEGEVLQLMNLNDAMTDEIRYNQVIECKTAKLFAASCELGVILSGQSAESRLRAAAFGRSIGMAFQIMDDLLDYTADEHVMGKRVGDDFREGKPTLPLIHALRVAEGEDAAFLRNCLVRTNNEEEQAKLSAYFPRVKSILTSLGSFEYTHERAKQLIDQSKMLLNHLPDTIYKKALAEMCDYSLVRDR